MPPVHHRRIDVDGVDIFYREAGPSDAPVLLLPHGYPASSFVYRNLMPALADRWRTLAPDFPGWGQSATPADFAHDFDGYAAFLARFLDRLGIGRVAIWLHDFGSQIGLRFAIAHPERVAAAIIQNGDIYEDTLGPNYDPLKEYWNDPTPERRAALADAITLDGYRHEFIGGTESEVAERVPPDLWTLHWALTDPQRRSIYRDVIAGLRENRRWFPRYQAWLRERQPPALILWGPRDGFMPEAAGRAYLRDLPQAELHLFDDGGHWLLETHLDQLVPLIRDFLTRALR
ncbi:alpha/beta hydrolase [Sphingomonas sp.]|uniref:alpha/beta fold hydrolase n=1 Tax=Sphingomonas sp. TaxID=28214 RepID=UPI002ED837DE